MLVALLCQSSLLFFGGVFDLKSSQKKLDIIDVQISQPDAWATPEKLTSVLQEKSKLESEISKFLNLKSVHDEMQEWLNLATEGDEDALEVLHSQINELAKLLQETELRLLLNLEEDDKNAILEIHPGAGGTESQDWAQMLLRMYTRWANNHSMKVEELEYINGDEAGIKSVTLRIKGINAFGFLKSEKGIHRLIRISPFDSSGRRHTSFASVDVIPDAGDTITLDIKESDLRLDTFRSSGPGGQSVNTTSSAVRITHLPTGISAQCQNEKSQHHNKETALSILKARLYDLEVRKRNEARQANYAEKQMIAFGSQIRTYTMQPYRLVKDHRTNSELSDVEAVLNGHIDKFQRDYLLYQHETTR